MTVDRPGRQMTREAIMTLARRLLFVALGGVAALAAVQHRSELAAAGAMLSRLEWRWVAVAAAAEIASMVVFARLQRWLLRAGGVDVELAPMVGITLAGNAMAMSLPGGAAWSATWAFGQLRRRGANRTLAAWVVLVAGALAGFAVFVLVVVGSWVAGGRGPVAGLRWLAGALAAIPVVVALGWLLARRSRTFHRALSSAWQAAAGRSGSIAHAGRLGRRTVHNLGLVRPGPAGWAEAFGLALANWLYDAVVLVAALEALRVPIPWRGLLVVYGLTQVSASLPVTPGGLGVVEGSMAALLIAYGVHAPEAFATVLLYRIISFWGLVPVGWAAFVSLELAGRRASPSGSGPIVPDEPAAVPALALAEVSAASTEAWNARSADEALVVHAA
jgi:uncharacterized membrane protein YbhN (UPF0104 family)